MAQKHQIINIRIKPLLNLHLYVIKPWLNYYLITIKVY